MADAVNNWQLHILSDDFFGCEWLSTGKLHIYTFGQRCEPIKVQVCSTLADAKIWVAMFGPRWLAEQGKPRSKGKVARR
jgi:hypothetical protein